MCVLKSPIILVIVYGTFPSACDVGGPNLSYTFGVLILLAMLEIKT